MGVLGGRGRNPRCARLAWADRRRSLDENVSSEIKRTFSPLARELHYEGCRLLQRRSTELKGPSISEGRISTDPHWSFAMQSDDTRILLIDSTQERCDALGDVFRESGYHDVVVCHPSALTLEFLFQTNPQIVLIDVDSPTRDTLEQLVLIRDHCPKPVVLLSQDESVQQIHAAIQSGVSAYVTEGISPSKARHVIEVAMATFSAFQALRQELRETKTQLEDRKLIDRAKGIVMSKDGISEDAAYHRMRRFAMDHKCSIADVARRILQLQS